MMQNIFLTHLKIQSPRWHQAFPSALIVDRIENLPDVLADVFLWVFLPDALLEEYLPRWTQASARVVVLTKIESSHQAKRVLEYGAHGYVHYLAATELIIQVEQVVRAGGFWLGADLMRQLIFGAATILKDNPTNPMLSVLTLRERAVADAVAAGNANKEIARDLNITERTVKAHLSAVFEKLHVRDRLQLVLIMSSH